MFLRKDDLSGITFDELETMNLMVMIELLLILLHTLPLISAFACPHPHPHTPLILSPLPFPPFAHGGSKIVKLLFFVAILPKKKKYI